jgi:ankyrin repeat protein
MSAEANLNPFLLAATTPDPDPRLLPLLRSRPELASAQDAHGYSLLHAAASYNHIDLLRFLVNEFRVDINLKDEDGETCLFVAETVDAARCLVEELHIDLRVRNEDGMDAMEKFESEQEFPEVAEYLRIHAADAATAETTGAGAGAGAVPNGVQHPHTLPPNVSISIGTESDATDTLDQEPDPGFRRRIDELASRENFHTDEGQRELRELISDAIRDVAVDGRDVRRRVG